MSKLMPIPERLPEYVEQFLEQAGFPPRLIQVICRRLQPSKLIVPARSKRTGESAPVSFRLDPDLLKVANVMIQRANSPWQDRSEFFRHALVMDLEVMQVLGVEIGTDLATLRAAEEMRREAELRHRAESELASTLKLISEMLERSRGPAGQAAAVEFAKKSLALADTFADPALKEMWVERIKGRFGGVIEQHEAQERRGELKLFKKGDEK